MDTKKLTKIIQELTIVRGELDLNVTDEQLFVQACTYHRGELANESKSPKNQVGSASSGGKGVSDVITSREADKPTEKQLAYIYRNNLDVDTKNLTKREAHAIIAEHKNK